MGVCISKESVLVNEQSTIESDTCIKIDNKSFDLFVFTKSTDLNKHKRIQANLTQIWEKEMKQLSENDFLHKEEFNDEFLHEYKSNIRLGIPNSLIRLFLIKLFKLNPKTAIGCYVNAISAVSPLPDIRVLQPGSEPYFGRKDLTNTYLTTTGSFMCRRLLYTLKLNYPSISVYCLMFPRVIQLLLWFQEEQLVYQTARIIIKESFNREDSYEFRQYLIHDPKMEKRAEKTILEYLADQIVIINLKKADIKLVLKDMLQNLVIGYIPVEYYGVLLTSYLSYGIAIIMKIIISIVLRYSKQINALYEGNARLLDYWKEFGSKNVDFDIVLSDAYLINDFGVDVKSQLTSFNSITDYFVNFVPQLEKPSEILNEIQVLDSLWSMIPRLFLLDKIVEAFSIKKDGLSIQDLYSSWKRDDILASLLIIKSKKNRVKYKQTFGVFLDRSFEKLLRFQEETESFLFNLLPQSRKYIHKLPDPIKIEHESRGGIKISSTQG